MMRFYGGQHFITIAEDLTPRVWRVLRNGQVEPVIPEEGGEPDEPLTDL